MRWTFILDKRCTVERTVVMKLKYPPCVRFDLDNQSELDFTLGYRNDWFLDDGIRELIWPP